MKTSVLTLARGREDHFAAMLEGCLHQDQPPDEIIAALMQPETPPLPPEIAERVRFVHVTGEKLPLAKARNAAAREASGELLIFLDVDCIPGPGFVGAARQAAKADACLTGDCRYLSGEDRAELEFEELWRRAERHPARPEPGPDGAPFALEEMTELWSLAFAVPRRAFERVGGFDEGFVGYGGEDTDFASRLGRVVPELLFVPGMRAVHQWHRVAVPPLQHFADIIANAEQFRAKHGRWCMDYWLGQLQERGFIRWHPEQLEVLREPSAHDLEAAWQDPSVRFS